jgi:hypothetical protein
MPTDSAGRKILVVSDAEIDAIPQGPDVAEYTTWLTPGPNDPVLPGPVVPTVNYNGAIHGTSTFRKPSPTASGSGPVSTGTGRVEQASVRGHG